jgi:hypothetical protein
MRNDDSVCVAPLATPVWPLVNSIVSTTTHAGLGHAGSLKLTLLK